MLKMCNSILRRRAGWLLLAGILTTVAAFAQISEVPARGPIRIISPRPGEVLRQNFVVVRYQLVQQATSASSPSYQVQLDGGDPVQTNDQQQAFRGLQPGRHTVQVQAVDANGTPVAGSQAVVEFTIAPPRSSLIVPEADAQETAGGAPASGDGPQLPKGGSAVPILSAVGLGSLIGGIYSALRTRR